MKETKLKDESPSLASQEATLLIQYQHKEKIRIKRKALKEMPFCRLFRRIYLGKYFLFNKTGYHGGYHKKEEKQNQATNKNNIL